MHTQQDGRADWHHATPNLTDEGTGDIKPPAQRGIILQLQQNDQAINQMRRIVTGSVSLIWY